VIRATSTPIAVAIRIQLVAKKQVVAVDSPFAAPGLAHEVEVAVVVNVTHSSVVPNHLGGDHDPCELDTVDAASDIGVPRHYPVSA